MTPRSFAPALSTAAPSRPPANRLRFNGRQIICGAVALAVGAAYYALFRPPLAAYAALGITGPMLKSDIELWQHALPTTLHVIGLSLLMAGILNCRRWPAIASVAGGWCAANIVCELLQSRWIFGSPPVLPGVFDPYDVAAAIAGGALAALLAWSLSLESPRKIIREK